MQRQESIASGTSGGGEGSSFGGSSFEPSAQGSEGEEHPAGQDETSNATEVLNQQGNIQEAVFGVLYTLSKERLAEGWRFVLFAMTVDYLQLAVFFISYNFPWDFDAYAWYWKWLNYHIYLGVFYALVGVLLAALALCIVIGVKFKHNSFTYVWPLKMLKVVMIFFFEVFYISTLGIFAVALDCSFSNPTKVNEVVEIAMAYFIAVATSELNPASNKLSAQAHCRNQLKRWALISLLTLIQQVFPSLTKIQAIAGIIITTYLCYEYVRYVPFQTFWVNGLQVALKYRAALKSKEPVVHKFLDELEVEEAEGPQAVACFLPVRRSFLPSWAYVSLAAMQAGLALLVASRKLKPSIGERFMTFVREREEKRGATTDGGSDLQSYAEFQTNYKALLEVHRQALKTTRTFWRQLCRKDVSFADLTSSFSSMEAAEKHADKTFKFVLDRYPNSAKLLHAYGTYLESVKNQPSHGARYHNEAHRLEDQATHQGSLTNGEGDMESSQLAEWSLGKMVDDSSEAVVVADEAGVIQYVNKKAVQMFGYKLGDLDGKPVGVLMPPPFSSHHSQYLLRYKKTGKYGNSNSGSEVSMAIKMLQHGDSKRFMGVFKPVQEDAQVVTVWVGPTGNIIGIDKGFEHLFGYHMADLSGQFVGAMGADGGVEQHFSIVMDKLKTWQYSLEELDTTRHTFEVPWKHKYGAALTISVSASFTGTEHVHLIALKFTLDETLGRLGLLSLSSTGHVVYANRCIEKLLDYEPGMLVGKQRNISDLLSTPYAQLHLRWMQGAAARAMEPNAPSPISCRSGRLVVLLGRNNKQVAVRMSVVPAQVGKVRCVTATISEVEVPEMDAWGGGDLKDLVKCAKRLLLLVRGDGTIVAFKCDPTVASQCFGQDMSELRGKNISEVVEDVSGSNGSQRQAQPNPQGCLPVPLLLAKLSKQTSQVHAAGGTASFRVADTEVDVQQLVDEGAMAEADWSSGGLCVIELWRDDMLEAMLDIDSQMRIKGAGTSLGSFARAEDLFGIKRTQLKHKADQGVSEKQGMEAVHVDGSKMLVQVQGADKHGDGSRQALPPACLSDESCLARTPGPWLAHLDWLLVSDCWQPHMQQTTRCKPQVGWLDRRSVNRSDAIAPVDERSEHSHDLDDRSSAADSDATGNQGRFSDFRRAKRFKKLNKMLSSHKALKTMTLLKRLFQQTVAAGEGANELRRAMTGAKVLMSVQDVTNPYSLFVLKGPAECAVLKDFYSSYMLEQASHVAEFATQEQSLLFGSSSKKLQAPVTVEERQLYLSDDKGVLAVERWPDTTSIPIDRSLQQSPPRARRPLKECLLEPEPAVCCPGTLSHPRKLQMQEYNFLFDNRNMMQDNLMDALELQHQNAKDRLGQESQVMITFLAIEAAAVIPLCCLCLWVLVNLVNRARLKLFNVFLVVPRPVVMQLATKDVNVTENEVEGEDGDDNDNDAWAKQQQQNEEGDAAAGAQSVGYKLSNTKRRKLHNRTLQAYVMLAPFAVWCIVVCIIYGVSIVVLHTSVAPIANLIAAEKLPFQVSTILGYAIGACATDDTGPGGLASQYQNMYGDPSLGLDGSLHKGNRHEALWFTPGCLSVNTSACYQPGDPYYSVSSNTGFALATYDPKLLTFNTPAAQFIMDVALPGGCLDDGLQKNTQDYLAEGESKMTAITIIQVLAVVFSLVMAWYFYFYLVAPFSTMTKKESLRVAELLSQLPTDMDVETMVRRSTSQEEEDDNHTASRHTSAQWWRRATGYLRGCWCGVRRKAKVVPAPGSGSKLRIIVTNRTSKDKEVPFPSSPAGDQGLSRKLKTYKETMHRHQSDRQSEAGDPTLWDTHRSPRRVAFKTPSSARSLATQFSRADSVATSLNASYFDPDQYLRRMLKDTRLGDLAGKHKAMLAEVGSLDSDMQMLVYENYNKFVTATDTIKVMNSSMGGMDTNMNTLKGLIDGVVERSNAVNGKLQHRQENIEELNQVRLLLHKLQGVFDLPKKLRAAIDKGAYEVAVDSYAEVSPLLKKYGHKAAFKRVSQEVEACVRELSATLRRQLPAKPDEVAESIQMIAKLGEPTESLQEDFLTCKRQRMEGWLQTAGLALKTIAVENGLLHASELGSVDESLRQKVAEWFPGEELPPLDKVIVELDSRFLTELTHTAAIYAQLFEPGGRQRLVKMARDVFQRYLKLARRALADTAATAAAAAAGISTRGELLRPLAAHLDAMQQQEQEEGSASGIDVGISADWGTPSLMQALYVVKNDISRLESMLPELNPRDRAGEIVEHTVRHHVGLCFAALEARVLVTVQALRSALEAAGQNGAASLAEKQDIVQRGVLILQNVIAQGVDRLLFSLKEYERQRWALQSWQDVFVSLVQGQLQNLFLSLSHQLLAITQLTAAPSPAAATAGPTGAAGGEAFFGRTAAAAAPLAGGAAAGAEAPAPFAVVGRRLSLPQPATPGGGEAPPPPPLLLLLLCRLCQVLEREVLGSILLRLQELFPDRPGLGGGREEPPAFVATELGRKINSAAETLLRGYVDAYGRTLTIAVRRSMEATDWLNHREPRAPRLVCDFIIEKMTEADAEVGCMTEARSARHSRTSSVSVHQLSHSGSGALGPAGGPFGGGSNMGMGMGMGLSQPLAGPGGAAARTQQEAMEAAVSKVFLQRDGPGGLELSRGSLLAAILAQALRSVVEAVRLTTLGRAGFQQIQLDIHYLRPRLQQFVSRGPGAGEAQGREALALLDELLGAAMERCSQPLLLEPAVLDRIVAGALAAQKQQQQQAPGTGAAGGASLSLL
ncbi:hypothetical protein N2152v2_007383 [Parachlorella kessleri]